MGGFICGVGNWIAGLADYEIRACKPEAPKAPTEAAMVSMQAFAALANAPKNACPDGFVYIPAGAFVMGSEKGAPDERPVRTIYLDAYCIDKSRRTYAQCQTMPVKPPSQCELLGMGCDGETIYTLSRGTCDEVSKAKYINNVDTCGPHWIHEVEQGRRSDGPNDSRTNVNWNEADAHCKGIGGRLPTEAEWEKAVRASGLGYGLYKADGAMEWTNDWYVVGAYELMSPQNPKGPDSGIIKVVRGCWSTNERGDGFYIVRESCGRSGSSPDVRYDVVGFRCVVDPKDLQAPEIYETPRDGKCANSVR